MSVRTSKEMPDSAIRGIVLQAFYRRRREGQHVQLREEDFANVSEELYAEDVIRACDQLGEHGLVDWKRPEPVTGELVNGWGKITAYGVDVVEGNATPAGIAVTIDSRSYSFHDSSHNIIGDKNVQIGDISVRDIANTINRAAASPEEKNKARGIIARAFEQPAVANILAGIAEGVTRAFKE